MHTGRLSAVDRLEAVSEAADEPGPFAPLLRTRPLDLVVAAAACPVIILAAPPGFGKSVVIRHYIEHHAPTALLARLGAGCDTFADFLGDFASALGSVAPRLRQALAHAPPDPSEASIRWFITVFQEHLESFVGTIVVDDLHRAAREPDVKRFLSTLIDRTHSRITWILGVRATAHLPIASWTTYGILQEPIGEQTLRFTRDEAIECARRATPSADAKSIEELYSLTAGWPAAFTLGMRAFSASPAAQQTTDRGASERLRQMLYDYLAEQVLRDIDPSQRDFLLDLSLLDGVRVDVLAREYERTTNAIVDFSNTFPFIHVDRDSRLFCDGLFADFLQDRYRSQGTSVWNAALGRAAAIRDRCDDHVGALALYARAGRFEEVVRIVDERGLALLSSGYGAVLHDALRSCAEHCRSSCRTTLVQALLASFTGHLARSDALFDRASHLAATDLDSATVSYQYALDLIRRNRGDSTDALRVTLTKLVEHSNDTSLPDELRISIDGTLACGYALLGEQHPHFIVRALRVAEAIGHDTTRATVYHQASFVAFVTGDLKRALSLSRTAVDLARELHLHALAARCHSVRYSVHMATGYEPQLALTELEAMIDEATRAGDAFLAATALSGAYALFVDMGNDEPLPDFRRRIEESTAYGELETTSLNSAEALRRAWHGDFRAAYDAVQDTGEAQASALRSALRNSEIALYAAACGEREAALESAQTSLGCSAPQNGARADDRRRFVHARVNVALTCLLLAQSPRANRIIMDLERSLDHLGAFERSIIRSARACYLSVEMGDPLDAAPTFAREIGFGGFARLLEALPFKVGQRNSPLALLTKAELAILREIATGATSAEIASAHERSIHTINVHVAAIMKKLNCATRREAIALAREHGIVT